MSSSQSIEKQAYDALGKDLMKINKDNGYSNSIVETRAGAVSFADDNILPIAGYLIGNSQLNQITRGPGAGEYTTDLLIDVIYSGSSQAELVEKKLSIVDDIKKHFRKDLSVQSASWSSIYNLSQVVNGKTIGNITSITVDKIIKGLDWKQLRGRCLFVIKIKFIELI